MRWAMVGIHPEDWEWDSVGGGKAFVASRMARHPHGQSLWEMACLIYSHTQHCL